jgi:hypothetical protein
MVMPDKPNVLFHYTTMEGLKGIIKTESLWTTKIHYLNDASELTKSLAMAGKILNSLKTGNDKKDKTKIEAINQMIQDVKNWEQTNICVASLCTNGDLLSQWRGYGTFGSAYSIGFNTKQLEDKISDSKFEIGRCAYYSDKEYFNVIYKYIEDTISQSAKVSEFIGTLIRKAALMKMDCFREEDEWRVVSWEPKLFDDEDFEFRVGRSMIIPYFAIPIDVSSIVEVKIGPCHHPELVEDAIAGMFFKYNKSDVPIKLPLITRSKIPYRVF